MDNDTENRIREHAFLLWESAGCPEGRAAEFWLRAREVELGLTQPTEPEIDKSAEEKPPASDPPATGDFA